MKTLQIFLILLLVILFNIQLSAQVGVYRVPATAAPSLFNSPFANWGTYVGDSAGFTMNFGFHCSFFGHAAGFSLNNDADNTLIGSFANYRGTTGIDNVVIGARAGYRNNGSDITFIGNMAGYHNTTGFDLVFIGEDAGYQNTTGGDNVFIGEDAGYNNTTGGDNTFVGNTAGRQNQGGYRNTAIGNEALFDLGGPNAVSSHHNTAVGDSAGIDNGIGNYNTFVGAACGAANESASRSTFIGYRAGYDNDRVSSSGQAAVSGRNTFVGFRCADRMRSGYDNVGMGSLARMAGFASGINRLRERTTFMGARALVWADDVVAIGYEVDARKQYGIAIGREANSDGVNSIAIGYQAAVLADNETRIGNNAMANIGGVVNWTATSDGRLKSAVKENVPGLRFINHLRPVTYQMDMEKAYSLRGDTVPEGLVQALEDKKQTRYSGFIAQEVEQIAEDLEYEFSGVYAPPDSTQMYGLRYSEFVVPLVKAVQELDQKVEQQQQQLETQAQQIAAYERQLAQYQRILTALTEDKPAGQQAREGPQVVTSK